MRTLNEAPIAFSNIIHRQGTQAINTEIFTYIRPNDVPVYDPSLDLVNAIVTILLRVNGRHIAKETTCERIACTRRIGYFFERVTGCPKEGAGCAGQQRSV